MFSTSNNLDHACDQQSDHETFALRWSITLFDVRLGLIIVLGDNGLELDVKCGGTTSTSATDQEKDL